MLEELPNKLGELNRGINSSILNGRREGYRTFPMEDEIEYFQMVFNSPKFNRDFKKFVGEYKTKILDNFPDGVSKGFLFFGSWMNGSAKFDSDFDISVFNITKSMNSTFTFFSKNFDGRKIHFQEKDPRLQMYLNVIESDRYTLSYAAEYISGALIGMPFGPEIISLQKEILNKIANLPQAKRESLWSLIYAEIYRLETGLAFLTDPQEEGTEHEQYGKYFILKDRFMSFEQFKERWKKRCDFANEFCRKNNIEF